MVREATQNSSHFERMSGINSNTCDRFVLGKSNKENLLTVLEKLTGLVFEIS